MKTRFSKASVSDACRDRHEKIMQRWSFNRNDGWDQIVQRAKRQALTIDQIVEMAVDYGRKEAFLMTAQDIEGGWL